MDKRIIVLDASVISMVEARFGHLKGRFKIRELTFDAGALLMFICCAVLILLAGCRHGGQDSILNIDDVHRTFRPCSVHFKSSFTRIIEPDKIKQQPGKIEVYIELQDQFSDSLKSLGRFRFEVYKYQSGAADSLGARFPDGLLDEIDLSQIAKNQNHWDRTLRNYHFTLKLPDIPASHKKIVLMVTFTNQSGKRFENTLVLNRNSRVKK